MRILYLTDIRFPLERANGIQTVETCYALAERGHTVVLLVRPDTQRPRRDPFEFYGLAPCARLIVRTTVVFGSPVMRRVAYLAQAVIAVATAIPGGVDVVITRDLGVASAVLRLPRRVRPPLVYESHGFSPALAEAMPNLATGAAAASPSKIRRLLGRERRVWRDAEGYIAISNGLTADLIERLGTRDALMAVADGLRLDPQRRFVPPRRQRSPVVAFAGHLYPNRGVDVLLRALALLPDVRGLIIGGHPAEADLVRLQTMARELGIDDRVTFTGLVQRNHVPTLLEQADVLLMPYVKTLITERYASPLKLFEYMGLGKPIVGSDLPAVREILQDGENARLVEPGDPDALAAGIRQVLDDGDFAERIARRAFEQAPAYSWERRAERIETLLDRVVSGEGRET